jgi:hypothetical protein
MKKMKILPYSWIGKVNIVNMSILSKSIYRFSVISHQNTNDILHRATKKILKLIWKHKRPQIKQSSSKRTKQETSQYPILKYYRAVVAQRA